MIIVMRCMYFILLNGRNPLSRAATALILASSSPSFETGASVRSTLTGQSRTGRRAPPGNGAGGRKGEGDGGVFFPLVKRACGVVQGCLFSRALSFGRKGQINIDVSRCSFSGAASSNGRDKSTSTDKKPSHDGTHPGLLHHNPEREDYCMLPPKFMSKREGVPRATISCVKTLYGTRWLRPW